MHARKRAAPSCTALCQPRDRGGYRPSCRNKHATVMMFREAKGGSLVGNAGEQNEMRGKGYMPPPNASFVPSTPSPSL